MAKPGVEVVVEYVKIPKIHLSKEVFEKIGEAVSAGIVLNIKKSKQSDGTPIQDNKQSTIARKRKMRRAYGGMIRPLIDEKKRFIKTKGGSWRWFAKPDSVTVEPATAWLVEISKTLQMRGYTGWFGISERVGNIIKKLIADRVKELLAKAAKGPKTKITK